MARGLSGNQAKVIAGSSTIAECTGWEADLDRDIQKYNAQSGGGWQKTLVGNKKITGTIKGKYDVDAPIETVLNTDSLVTLVLYHNASQRWISMSARIAKMTYGANIDNGEPQDWNASFESDGAPTFI